MVISVLLMATMQPAAAAELPVLPTCSLVTPRGDVIGFFVWSDETPNEIRVSATQGSAWPAATVAGLREDGPSLRFVIGSGDGLALELSAQDPNRQQRAATLIRRQRGRTTIPVAYGFCEERPVASEPAPPGPGRRDVGANDDAFRSASWPEADCGLILDDGRRIRLRTTWDGRDELRLQSPDLWSGEPIATRISWSNARGAHVGAFSRPGGPEGVEIMFTEGSTATKLIRLRQLGDPTMPNATGYGICGYRSIVRRPAR